MFGNFSLPELLVVGALALIVIGPKDLPRMMRSVGRFVGQARGLARQFQDSMNDAAREADLEEFREARKLLKGKSGVTDMLNEKLDIDDDKPSKPSKNRVLTPDELKQRAEESGFAAMKDDAVAPQDRLDDLREETAAPVAEASLTRGEAGPAMEPLIPDASEETTRTADAKSG